MSRFRLPDDPKEVWLIGKGPSLDTIDWSTVGKYRIAINEAAFHIPDLWAAAAWDLAILNIYVERKLPPDTLIIQAEHTNGPVFKNRIVMNRTDRVVAMSTAAMVVQLLEYCHVERLHLLAFDSLRGDCGYAGSLKIPSRAVGYFNDLNANLEQRLIDSKIQYTFD